MGQLFQQYIKVNYMKKKELFLLLIILLGAFMVRLYGFGNHLLDWHSWRQADTSSVSRNFATYGFDLLHPTFHDLSKGVSLLDNPNGYRFVEFPIYNVLQAGGFVLFDHFTLVEWGRIVSIFASLGSIIFLYILARKYISSLGGFVAALFYAFVPYSIYYSRTVLPDQLMVMCMLAGLCFFDKWLSLHVILRPRAEESHKILQSFRSFRMTFWFILTIIFTASAILIKPYVLFFSLAFIYLAWRKFGFGFLKKIDLWMFLFLSVAPFVLWRLWMLQYPEGIPQSNWLFNGTGIRFKGAFFHWLFAQRIAQLILGYFGLPFVIIGIMGQIKKEGLFFLSLVLSSLIYMSVIATGNVQHDYYQMIIIPMLALFFAKGVTMFFEQTKNIFNPYVSLATVSVCVIFMLSFGWYSVRDYYNLQHQALLEAGRAADRVIPKHTKIIAAYGGDTTFLHETNRNGWPVVDRSFYEFIKAGAKFIVFANPTSDELKLGTYFKTVERDPQYYVIFDLTNPTPEGVNFLRSEELQVKKDKGK